MKILRTFLALALALATSAASAANLQISPPGMTLTPTQKVESMRIKNAGSSPIKIQMRAFSWAKDPQALAIGETIGEPTGNVRFGPAQFEIASGGSQIVRVIRTAPDKPTEQAYRIVVSELPGEAMVESGAQILLNYNLPLFYRPTGAQPVLKARWEGTKLVVSNSGQATAQLSALQVGGKPILMGLVGYVLPGSTMAIETATAPAQIDIKVNGESRILSTN